MRRIYVSVFFFAALLQAQAQIDDRLSGNFGNLDAGNAGGGGAAGGAGALPGAGSGGLADPTATAGSRSNDDDAIKNLNNFGLGPQSANQRQGAAARPNQFVIATPEGPGIHAGFQARGPNYAASMSGGLKTSNGGALETGVNLLGRFGDGMNTGGQQRGLFGAQSSGFGGQGQQDAASPIADGGATFAVAYRPGLLSALGNMLNPFRLIEHIGGAVAGGMAGLGQGVAGLTQGIGQGVADLTQGIGQGLGQGLQGLGQGLGLGQASASFQAQSQYLPPQAQRTRSNNGVGVTWRPLYQALPFMGNNNNNNNW